MESARWAFLISGVTDQRSRDRLEALAPALEQLGTWQEVDRPESRLIYASSLARSQGLTPVHLAFGLPQSTYLTPAVPTILVPIWDSPDVPCRSFVFDVRQNWAQLTKRAACLIAPSAGQTRKFQETGLGCPVSHVPTPARVEDFTLPEWDKTHKWTIACRHVILGATPEPNDEVKRRSTWVKPEPGVVARPNLKRKAWNQFRHAFHAISPYYGDDARIRNMKIRKNALRLIGRTPTLTKMSRREASILGLARHYGKLGYDLTVRPYLSDHALSKVGAIKDNFKRILRRPSPPPVVPEIPRADLTLGGLVYTAVVDPSDPRSNVKDLLSSFFLAFNDRPDVTLVLLFTTPESRGYELTSQITSYAASLGLQPKCRVAVICEPLSDSLQRHLLQASTYVVTATLAESEPLFLRRALAGGRLVVGPDHSDLGELLDAQNAFIVESHPEPTHWSHDPERKFETSIGRIVWSGLKEKFVESARMVEDSPLTYLELSRLAREKVARSASVVLCVLALERVLEAIPNTDQASFAWAV